MIAKTVAPSVKQIGRFGLVLVIAIAAVATAKAGSVTYTAQQRVACMPDAVRLCAGEIPNVSRIRDCMVAKKSALSAACRAVF